MTSFARILLFRFHQFAQRSSEIGILEEFAFRIALGLINLHAGRILRELARGEAACKIGGKREPVFSDTIACSRTFSKLIVPQRSSRMYHASTVPGIDPE